MRIPWSYSGGERDQYKNLLTSSSGDDQEDDDTMAEPAFFQASSPRDIAHIQSTKYAYINSQSGVPESELELLESSLHPCSRTLPKTASSSTQVQVSIT